MEEPIGIAKKDIQKGEEIEIVIYPDGRMFSEAIEFFGTFTQLSNGWFQHEQEAITG